MAREESDREDLLREATALVERVEFAPRGGGEPIVLGFRASGAFSAFFGGDTAYHFNSNGELRRAYVGNLLYKSEQGRLVSLERIRRDDEVQLIRRELSSDTQAAFLASMQASLAALARQIDRRELNVVGQVPAAVDVVSRSLEWLRRNPQTIIAQSPHAR